MCFHLKPVIFWVATATPSTPKELGRAGTKVGDLLGLGWLVGWRILSENQPASYRQSFKDCLPSLSSLPFEWSNQMNLPMPWNDAKKNGGLPAKNREKDRGTKRSPFTNFVSGFFSSETETSRGRWTGGSRWPKYCGKTNAINLPWLGIMV